MAFLFIAAGIVLVEKLEERKQRKRDKKMLDAQRYQDLRVETSERLARTQSGTLVIGHSQDLEGDGLGLGREDGGEEEGNEKEGISSPPPRYEDVVANGHARWR